MYPADQVNLPTLPRRKLKRKIRPKPKKIKSPANTTINELKIPESAKVVVLRSSNERNERLQTMDDYLHVTIDPPIHTSNTFTTRTPQISHECVCGGKPKSSFHHP